MHATPTPTPVLANKMNTNMNMRINIKHYPPKIWPSFIVSPCSIARSSKFMWLQIHWLDCQTTMNADKICKTLPPPPQPHVSSSKNPNRIQRTSFLFCSGILLGSNLVVYKSCRRESRGSLKMKLSIPSKITQKVKYHWVSMTIHSNLMIIVSSSQSF